MNGRKIISIVFLVVALVLGVLFFNKIQFPSSIEQYFDIGQYFDKDYFNQYGPLAICVELLIAGIYLFRKHPKTNIALAIFGFTALLDPLFNALGVFDTNVPLYGSIVFVLCAIPALWIAFTNTFGSGRITFFWAFGSFLVGLMIELFFNYW